MYSREIDGRVLTLAASGWTYESTFVLYDYETESLWYHMPGENGLTCISMSEFAGRKLSEFPSSRTKWSEWKKLHPDSKIMKIEYVNKNK